MKVARQSPDARKVDRSLWKVLQMHEKLTKLEGSSHSCMEYSQKVLVMRYKLTEDDRMSCGCTGYASLKRRVPPQHRECVHHIESSSTAWGVTPLHGNAFTACSCLYHTGSFCHTGECFCHTEKASTARGMHPPPRECHCHIGTTTASWGAPPLHGE